MSDTPVRDLEAFRARARKWISDNLPRLEQASGEMTMAESRQLQATIYDAGYAGIAVPAHYGGAGLDFEHQQVWAEEVDGYQVPVKLFPSIAILGVTLLDHGAESLKTAHLPRILRGDEVWIQLLSEPSGGSDMAGALTRATRDGETWLINGSKTWSSLAAEADYGICLARSAWDLPKHKGLSMFAVPLRDPKVTIEPIVNSGGGPAHFFEEFFDDVQLPADHLIGMENGGWAVAHTLLVHERNAIAGIGHGLGLGGGGDSNELRIGVADLFEVARSSGTLMEPVSHQLIAEAYIDEVVRKQLSGRVAAGMRSGSLQGNWGSLVKLGLAVDTLRRAEIALALAGPDGVIWLEPELEPEAEPEDGELAEVGRLWLTARALSIGGGTNEIQRNTISERLLGMPREPALDRDEPFSQTIRRRSRSRPPTNSEGA